MFSVALMMKMVARFAGLPRISSEGLCTSEGGFEYYSRVRLGLLVNLPQLLCTCKFIVDRKGY